MARGRFISLEGGEGVGKSTQLTALAAALLACAVNLLLGIVLIPSQGAQGAAIAMAGGLAVWNLVLLARARQLLGFDPSLLGALARVWRR